ncbi:MAG: MFS transporter [Hyphomicrobiales bacterium]|nr:MAG: MFS transporter [Hyphomicrobiales bacterium]
MSESFDATKLIEEGPVTRRQRAVVGMIAAIAAIEGFDAQMMGYVAPAITAEWGLKSSDFTVVFTAGVIGMILGALFVGPVADRRGRKVALLGGVAILGLFTALAPLASSVTVLVMLRFVAGLGVGAATPTLVALASEYVPARIRATTVMAVISAISIGAFVGGLAAAWLIPVYGWRTLMLVGGTIPVVLALLATKVLPESLTFLVATGRQEKARATISWIAPTANPVGPLVLDEASADPASRHSVRQILSGRVLLNTILLWLSFFPSLMVAYFVFSWVPSLFVSAGMSMRVASIALSVIMLGSVFGGIVMGVLVDRTRLRFGILSVGLVVAALAIGLFLLSVGNLPVMLIALFLVGFGALGCQMGLFAAAAEAYSTRVRSTGVGWASGMGRLGSLAGPMIGGVLVAQGVAPYTIFGLLVVPILFTAIVVGALASRLRPGRAMTSNTAAPAGTVSIQGS